MVGYADARPPPPRQAVRACAPPSDSPWASPAALAPRSAPEPARGRQAAAQPDGQAGPAVRTAGSDVNPEALPRLSRLRPAPAESPGSAGTNVRGPAHAGREPPASGCRTGCRPARSRMRSSGICPPVRSRDHRRRFGHGADRFMPHQPRQPAAESTTPGSAGIYSRAPRTGPGSEFVSKPARARIWAVELLTLDN